jgi:phosphatidylinositol glycan class H protein
LDPELHPTLLPPTHFSDVDPMTMQEILQRLTAPPAQILRTIQPTPFTASYTVSTRPIPRTVLSKIASHVSVLIRVVIGLLTAFVLWILSGVYNERTEHVLLYILGHIMTEQLLDLSIWCQWVYTAPCALIVLTLVFRRNYTGKPHHSYAPYST